ncbi:energy transducer TonB [Stenotrophomonas sp. YAU14D1_LEIMI4_1]|uniref:energy transducer TonB n=1 Tax=Stenotrophomonas sp. YAU14D1_LEIMI4_1 TaxID=2072407 RepID=UPI000D53E884|nr:energy transducer TonB [Stenotrophomonas sp. YAU14D1_LEIMI4_1]AWH25904.1 energy transducer TonB [Stenotrophomonas sp. YAU14D1_LEIMI4_1]
MNVRLLSLSLLAATGLAGCGGAEPPAAPAAPPTEVAAVKTPPPQYPLELACLGVGGTSTFKVVIGTDGKPSDVALLTGAGNPQLDELARSAVQGWQFKAATRNGAAVPATIQVPVSFNPPQPKPDQCFAIEERARRGG